MAWNKNKYNIFIQLNGVAIAGHADELGFAIRGMANVFARKDNSRNIIILFTYKKFCS